MGSTKQEGKRRRKAKRTEPKEQPQTPQRKRAKRGTQRHPLSRLKRATKWFYGFVAVLKRVFKWFYGFVAEPKRVPKWFYGLVAVAGLIVMLITLYPWLSIYPRDTVDIRNPYSTPFDVTNDRHIPITSVTAKCIFDFGKGNHIAMGYDNFVAPLGHKDTIAAPCFHIIAGNALRSANRATITMQIRYRLFGVFPRSQQFRFHSDKADDGSSHWVYDG
jgi:hypothetical protein